MSFNEPMTRTFTNQESGIELGKAILGNEFNAHHHTTFKYEVTPSSIKVEGATYLVEWFAFLLEQETARNQKPIELDSPPVVEVAVKTPRKRKIKELVA